MKSPLHFHHIGIGTPSFEEAIDVYTRMGYRLLCALDDPGLDVRIAFLQAETGPYLEIVAPLGPDGPLKSLLSRRLLPSPYHTCYATPDIREASAELRELGFLPLGEARPAAAFKGALIAYHYHAALGLLELVQGTGDLSFEASAATNA